MARASVSASEYARRARARAILSACARVESEANEGLAHGRVNMIHVQ